MPNANKYNFSQALLAKSYVTEQEELLETQKTLLENIQLTKASLIMLYYINQMDDFPKHLTQELKTALQSKASNGALITLYSKIHQALIEIKARHSPEK